MKRDDVRNELLLSDTSVPDVFLVQYAPLLGREAVVAYLFIRMLFPSGRFTQDDTGNMNFLSPSDLSKALAELIENDLLIRNENEYTLTDLKKKEVEEYIKVSLARGGADRASLPGLSADEKQRNVLADSISKSFYGGRMAYVFHRLVDKCLYEYKFESEFVYRLFEECAEGNSRQHYKISYMEKKAEDWYKSGYTTMEALSHVLAKKKRVEDLVKIMGKLSRKRLDGIDIERIETWVNALDISPELAEYAYRVNSDYRKTVTMKNVEDKLTEWVAADVRTLDRAVVYEAERHNENKLKAKKTKSRENAWKTGKDAGIVKGSDDGKKAAKAPSGPKPEDGIGDDVILALFGDDEE